jgi:type I restriction enzyme S subunit
MSEWNTEHELHELAYFVDSKIDAKKIAPESYISTDNMNVDRGGIEPASKLPSVPKFNHFKENDTLFSNIRTYFRKVWLAKFEGGSSADVLVFRTKSEKQLNPIYLYYLLSSKEFSDYTVLTAKGVKMPRGDKSAMMQYKFLLPEPQFQKAASKTLKSIDDKIENNRRMNETLEGMAQAIFKSWFVDFDPVRAKVEVLERGGSAEEARLAAMQAISGKSPEALARLKTENPESYTELSTTADTFPSTFTTSPLGDIPEGWEIKNIGSIVNRLSAPTRYTKKEVLEYGAIPVFEQGEGILLGYHDGEPVFKATPKNPKFIFGDHTCITHLSCSNFDISQNVIPLEGKDRPTLWVYYAIQGKQVFQEYRRHWSEFIVKELCVAPEDICILFSETVSHFYIMKETLISENNYLKQIRDSLLPKLLSGEIDIYGDSYQAPDILFNLHPKKYRDSLEEFKASKGKEL